MKLAEKEHDTLARRHFLRRQRVIPSAFLYGHVARAGDGTWTSKSKYCSPGHSGDVWRVGKDRGLNLA